MPPKAWRWLRVLLLVLPALLFPGHGEEARKPAVIRVVLDSNYPPYVFYDASGQLQGVLVDEWALWQKKTGIRAELHPMDWSQALRRMEAGEFDVIDTIFKTDARGEILAFTPPYARIEVPIFFHKDLSGITGLDSLHGFQVGVKTSDAAADVLHDHGVAMVSFRNYEAIIEAAEQHRLQVFIMDEPPALYYLNKFGVRSAFRKTAPVSVGAFHRAVAKQNVALLRQVEDGFAAFTPDERREIDNKWFGRPVNGYRGLAYFGYASAIALALIAALFGWNRALRRIVAQRTSALRESEARFRQVVENLHDVFWMRDAQTRQLMYVSPAYQQMWGRTCESLYAAPQSWIESVHPEDRARIQDLANRSEPYEVLFRITQPGGAVRWIRDRAFTVRNAKGDVTRVVGIASDVTEHKQLEQQVLRAQRMEAIGALSSGIAHDLNNILAPILLSAALLKDSLNDQQQRALVTIIERGADRGAEMLRQLLIYSRGTDGNRTPVRISELLKEMSSIVRETFPRNIVLKIETEPDLPPVIADPTQLHQVLLNLCVNARDAMPDGGTLTLRAHAVEVTATAARLEPQAVPGFHVLLEVHDTGAGIAPEVLDRIFEPFFTTKEIGKGTGLGLSTVQGIVRSHGGFVAVRSEPGKGSAFRVFLPASAMAFVDTSKGSNSPFARGAGELVVVADDEDAVRSATILVLERNGYRALGAADGSEALSLVLQHRGMVRVLLTDIMMPVMGGVALVRAVRKIDSDIRVVATTGLQQDTTREELVQLGVNELLLKPTTARDLLAAIKRVLA